MAVLLNFYTSLCCVSVEDLHVKAMSALVHQCFRLIPLEYIHAVLIRLIFPVALITRQL